MSPEPNDAKHPFVAAPEPVAAIPVFQLSSGITGQCRLTGPLSPMEVFDD